MSRQSGLDAVSAETLLSSAPVPVVGIDPEGLVLFWNPAAERVFGWAADEVIGEPYPLVPEENRDDFRVLVEQAMAGHMLRGELMERRRKDGDTVSIEVWTSLLRDEDGGIRGIIGVLHDVTQRLAMERDLVRSEARVRSLFDQAADAMFLHEPGGEIVEVNEQACRDLGYDRNELIGMQVDEIVFEAGPDEKMGRLSSLEPGDRVSGLTGLHRRKDGSTYPVEAEIAIVHWRDRPLALAIARDVSERRRMEEELRHSQKMQALGELVGGLAHDFNNRLTSILGFTTMLLDETDPDDPHHDDLMEIHDSATRSARLTDQLLAFGRRQMLRPECVDPGELVRDLVNMVGSLLPETIELRIDVDRPVGPVYVDRSQMQQVLLNLTLNARDAMPEGGRLAIRTRSLQRPLTPDVEDPGPWTALEVSDTGVGMDADVRERAFEPFFTTKDVGEGTGLGLSTVYGIVEQSGGHVSLESRPGEGTTITIALPVASAETGPPPQGDDEAPPSS